MIEVVFSDSACGSLKMAQHYGDGKFSNAAIGVIVSHADGSRPTEEEIQAAQREAEERERLEWEHAIPMGGSPADVYGFNFVLSIGDISENVPGEKRRQVLEWLYSIYPNLEDGPAFTMELMQKARDVLEEVCSRISAGENVRIWYSNNPDELCGLYWFLTQLWRLGQISGKISLVRLPEWEIDENDKTVWRTGWGGVAAGEWSRYASLERTIPLSFCESCAVQWHLLQRENAPLRAILNGKLVSVTETLYDEFIVREIAAEADEFHEAMLIGKILGKYELGIGDAWIAQRIEGMINDGKLAIVTSAGKDMPIYHRKVKKLIP